MTEIIFRSDVTVELIKSSASDLDVVAAARVSTQAERSLSEVSDEEARRLINFLMRERHGSPFEHSVFTFLVSAPIFVWREHMRHRMVSYNEESGRYRQLEPVFYVPATDRPLKQIGKPGAYEFVEGTYQQQRMVDGETRRIAREAYESYLALLDEGVAREVARMVLPVNIYSTAYVTINARSLMNFLSLRKKYEHSTFKSYPQREIEMVAEKYERVFADKMSKTHAAFLMNGCVAP